MTRNIVPRVAAVILVGGKARRLNGVNKCDLVVGERTCLEWTLDIFKGQVAEIALSVGLQDRFGHGENHEIIYDWPYNPQGGGLAFAILGILSWATDSGYDAIITTPVDTPFLSKTYTTDLKQIYDGRTPVVFDTPRGLQGLHAIWPVTCYKDIKETVLDRKTLKISKLHDALKSKKISLSKDQAGQFKNINNAHCLREARSYFKT